MITREELEAILDDDNNSEVFSKENEDHDVIAIKLLRDRIPYDVERQIICAAEHDIIYLVDVESALPYLSKEDAAILQDCNCFIDEDTDSFALFT